MKTALFTILFSFISFCSYAQEEQNRPQSVSVSITATVTNSIELTTIQTLELQNADIQNNIIDINPILSSNAGNMIARGNPGSKFSLDYLEVRELTNTRGTGVLFFEYRIAGNYIYEQNTAEILDPESRELQFNEDGEFYIWIGGRIDVTNAEPGNYEGDFSIEIEYI